MDSDLNDLDFYGTLGIEQSATEKEIKTAYRKALQWHPDKNPDNPKAAQLFLQLSKILTILTYTAARLDYDKLVNAKTAAKLCEKERDSDIAPFIDNINKRRNELSVKRDTDENNFKKPLERLRKESDLRQLETEKEKNGSFILKLKWKKQGVYNKANLTSLFSKYGDKLSVVVLKNSKSMAFVEYKSKTSAAYLDYEAMILERFQQAVKPLQKICNSSNINTEEHKKNLVYIVTIYYDHLYMLLVITCLIPVQYFVSY